MRIITKPAILINASLLLYLSLLLASPTQPTQLGVGHYMTLQRETYQENAIFRNLIHYNLNVAALLVVALCFLSCVKI